MKVLVVLLAVPLFGSALPSKPKPRPTQDAGSCRQTAQSFYDWYVPKVVPELRGTPIEILRQAKNYLSPTLYEKLMRDYDASAHAEEVVGLDWDPFMASQDPEPYFIATSPRMLGKHCRVSIHGIDKQGNRRKAATALLEWTGTAWLFTDLLEDNSSLLKILDDLERDRQKLPKNAAKSNKKD